MPTTANTRAVLVLVAASACVASASGCCPPKTGFDAPLSSARLGAIRDAADTGDKTAVPHLIGMLESDDPAIRLTSARALRRISRHDFGYDASAHPIERGEAIDRWIAWYDGSASEGAAADSDPR